VEAEFTRLDLVTDGTYRMLEMFVVSLALGADRPGLALSYYLRIHPDTPDDQNPIDPKSQPESASLFAWHSERYWAACAAVHAGSGQGSDTPPPHERPALRHKALDWLSADLRQWKRYLAADAKYYVAAQDAMNHWLTNSYLKEVRDEAELAKLPPDEQAAWEKLWAEVRKLRDDTKPEVLPPPRRE
jgi:hypothetical protein